jgi:hypothetical protein
MRGESLVGKRFGKLVVKAFTKKIGNNKSYICNCECGELKEVLDCNLRSGRIVSCGCVRKQSVKDRSTTHGMSNTRIYSIWRKIIDRTTNENNIQYHRYGGRGITIHPSWLESFDTFYKDMGDPPTDRHEIDRKDNNGNYCKDNCKWSTRKEQQNNTSRNRIITFNGESHSLSQWSEITGVNSATIYSRLKNGWSIERALSPFNYSLKP